jgi:RHS repeat-associated protein
VETDEEDEVFVTYTRGNALISMRREGASYFYHYDGLGSVRQLTGKEKIICLIATAVYGTPMAEEVRILSMLRDEYLLTNRWGERLVAFYYRHSPTAANFIRDNEWAKRAVRIVLWPLIRITEFIVKEADAASVVGNPNPNPSESHHQTLCLCASVPLCLCANPNPSRSTRQRRVEGSPPQQQLTRSVSIEAEYTYDTFGNLIEGNDHNNPYGFTGEQQFREADRLIFLRARYYDPSVGRFVSRDPILLPMVGAYGNFWVLPHFVRVPQLLHPYVYVVNNPVNLVDPSGLLPGSLHGSPPGLLLEGVGPAIGAGAKVYGGGKFLGLVGMTAYLTIDCVACLHRAQDLIMRAARILSPLCFQEWFGRVNPGKECLKICGEGALGTVEVALELIFKLPAPAR